MARAAHEDVARRRRDGRRPWQLPRGDRRAARPRGRGVDRRRARRRGRPLPGTHHNQVPKTDERPTHGNDRTMKVLILCGGYGSRLAGAGGDLPKPMVPVGGKPMVWHIMRGLSHWGFREFVLCLGFRSDLFKQYFLNLSTMLNDVTLELSSGG